MCYVSKRCDVICKIILFLSKLYCANESPLCSLHDNMQIQMAFLNFFFLIWSSVLVVLEFFLFSIRHHCVFVLFNFIFYFKAFDDDDCSADDAFVMNWQYGCY